MRFKALRHQPSDAARKSGYDNEGQLPDTLPDSRSRPGAAAGGIKKQTFNALSSADAEGGRLRRIARHLAVYPKCNISTAQRFQER